MARLLSTPSAVGGCPACRQPALCQPDRNKAALRASLLSQRRRLRQLIRLEAAANRATPVHSPGAPEQSARRQQQEVPMPERVAKPPAVPRPRMRTSSSKRPLPSADSPSVKAGPQLAAWPASGNGTKPRLTSQRSASQTAQQPQQAQRQQQQAPPTGSIATQQPLQYTPNTPPNQQHTLPEHLQQQLHQTASANDISNSSNMDNMDISRAFSARRNLARQQPLSAQLQPLTPALIDWFARAGISSRTLQANGVGMQLITNPLHPAGSQPVQTIALPYYRSGQLVDMRHLQLAPDGSIAASWLARGGRELYCSDSTLSAQGEVIMCCSELDKLAIEEACGVGAPVLAVPQPLPSWKAGESEYSNARRHVMHLERRLNTLLAAHTAAEGVGEATPGQRRPSGIKLLLPIAHGVVLAAEAGEAAQAVAAELARLLGEPHCRLVRWPVSWADRWELAGQPATSPRSPKDTGCRVSALDMLQKDGPAVLPLYLYQYAREFPISGLQHFGDYMETIWNMYSSPVDEQMALSTGWESLDEIYRVAPGELTLVTGVPNSGKSEWLDALAVNVAELHGWRFAVCSMEKRPRDHARQLVEKRARRPMLSAAYAGSVPRMTEQELMAAFEWVNYHFLAIAHGEEQMPNVEWVLEKARSAVVKYGVKGILIDPFNELDNTTNDNAREHEYVSALMGRLRRFAAAEGVHVWLVAHPRQLQQWAGHAPTLNDISGGANFMAKCDNGITVHRDWARHKDIGSRADDSVDGRSSGRSSPRLSRSSMASRDAATDASRDEEAAPDNSDFDVRIICGKVRNKTSGCQGERVLVYDPPTGRYHEPGYPPSHQEVPPPSDPQLRQQIRLFDEIDDARLEEEELAAAAAAAAAATFNVRRLHAPGAVDAGAVDFESFMFERPVDQFG